MIGHWCGVVWTVWCGVCAGVASMQIAFGGASAAVLGGDLFCVSLSTTNGTTYGTTNGTTNGTTAVGNNATLSLLPCNLTVVVTVRHSCTCVAACVCTIHHACASCLPTAQSAHWP